MNNHFCILPFIALDVQNDGQFKPCCKTSLAIRADSPLSFEQVWNAKEIQKLRKDILAGDKPESCRVCWQEESKNTTSYRQRMNEAYRDFIDTKLEFDFPKAFPVHHLRRMEFNFSNLCNLRCRHCSIRSSSSWKEEFSQVQHLTEISEQNPRWNHKDLLDQLKKHLPHLEVLLFAGGEPLLQSEHLQALEAATPYAQQITLFYNTNLTSFGKNKELLFEIWRQFKQVRISISIDGHHGLYEYIRTNASLTQVIENIHLLRERLPSAVLYGKPTIMTYNLPYLVEIYSLFFELDLIPLINRVHEPIFLSTLSFPLKYKAQIGGHLERKLLEYQKKITVHQWHEVHQRVRAEIDFMMSRDESHHWSKFIEYSEILDKNRKTSFIDWLSVF